MNRTGLGFSLHKKEIVASRGVITTNHPLASAAGIEMYSQGGNAFDAAIASLFALTVVAPGMVGIFGAGFFVVRDPNTCKIETIDNDAVAPLKATKDMYEIVKERQPGQNIFETIGRKNIVGPLAVATPGTLKAWEYVNERYGELDWHTVIAPAIRLARNGYRPSPIMIFSIEQCRSSIAVSPATAKTFLPGGKPVDSGVKIVMPEYADTLIKISEDGSDALYCGEIGQEVVKFMEENQGLITMDDLKGYRLVVRDPVKGVYRGDYEIYSMAPSSSGGTHIIQMLNMLESFDIGSMGFGSVEHLHLIAEALKIAFADRQRFMGDPALVKIPLGGLISKRYGEERAKEIGGRSSYYDSGDPFIYSGEGDETTHVSSMDADGNVVAATQTLNGGYGSGVTVPSLGILLNNCMALFDPRPNKANSVAGGKRMLSSMSPTIILRRGEPYLCIGVPGGLQIFPSIAQAIVNLIDFKMGIQEAVEAPRIWTIGIKGTPGERLLVESGVPQEIRDGLAARGHDVLTVTNVAGGMNGVLRDPETGMLHGGVCWRADGASMGMSGGLASPKMLVPNPLY